jgi:hypothetical protein
MMRSARNPWEITTIGLGLVMTIALIIGVGVASWSGKEGAVTLPSQAVIGTCNQRAAREAPQNKTTEPVKDGAIGAVIAVGAAGGAIVDAGDGAGKGAVKSDERYRAVYADCMRSRGYAS